MDAVRGLDLEALQAVAELRDPVGVLSVYVDASPRGGEGRDAAAVALRNELHELERRARDGERGAALREALERLRGPLDDLLSPRVPGQGRALFAGIANGRLEQVHVQPPLATMVVLEESAYVRPLLAVLPTCRPAGIVAVSRKEVRVLEWRPESAVNIAAYEVEPEITEWRTMKGPADPRTIAGQQSASQEDRFERRLGEERSRLVAAAGEQLARLVEERGWDVLVVAGEPETATALVGAVGSDAGVEVVTDPTVVGGNHSAAHLSATFAATVAGVRSRRALAAAETARDAALAGGKGALGVAETLEALAEGRVHSLLLDAERELEGTATADGRLYPADVVPPGVAPGELRREPHLAERMVERALATGASIVPVSGEAADVLAGHDGVAAILRW